MNVTEAQLMALLAAWLWPFLRVSGFVLAAPIIGTRSVPVRTRATFAIALTAVLAPVVAAAGPVTAITPTDAVGLLTAVHQVVIGATIGLVLRLLFVVFEFAGQLIAQQMGLGFAAMVDPQTGAQVPVVAQFYIILATLLFFVFDAHLALIALLASSFEVLPVGPTGIAAAGAALVVDWSAELFSAALLLGLPIVVALLAINFALGVMARAAPQLNIFAVGFPVMILFGIVLVFATLPAFPEFAARLFESALATAAAVLEAR